MNNKTRRKKNMKVIFKEVQEILYLVIAYLVIMLISGLLLRSSLRAEVDTGLDIDRARHCTVYEPGSSVVSTKTGS